MVLGFLIFILKPYDGFRLFLCPFLTINRPLKLKVQLIVYNKVQIIVESLHELTYNVFLNMKKKNLNREYFIETI